MAKPRVWVIVRVGWEYNDEYYYRPESEGGAPVQAFVSKVEAEEECLERNVATFRGERELGSYICGEGECNPADGVSRDDLKEILGVNNLDEMWDYRVPPAFTRAQVEALVKAVTTRFYEVHEVDLE